jgi:hypothetical protein
MSRGLILLSTPGWTVRLEVSDGQVIDAPPHAKKWTLGKDARALWRQMKAAPNTDVDWLELDVLAIVGSRFLCGPDAWGEAKRIIREELEKEPPDLVISGGAIGVDTLAQITTRQMGLPFDKSRYLPKVRRFHGPGGYEERDERIAQDCTRLLAIRCHEAKTYGSGWTHDRAKELGKPTRMEIV